MDENVFSRKKHMHCRDYAQSTTQEGLLPSTQEGLLPSACARTLYGTPIVFSSARGVGTTDSGCGKLYVIHHQQWQTRRRLIS